MRNVYISLSYGDTYRDVVRTGMLRHLVDEYPDIRVVIPTPAHSVPEVGEEVRHERVVLWPHQPFAPGVLGLNLAAYRERYGRGQPRIAGALRRLEERRVPEKPEVSGLFRDHPPSLVVTTRTQDFCDLDLVAAAHRRGIPTLAVVRSWDHLHKQLRVRAGTLGVGNRTNQGEAVARHHYAPGDVRLLGTMSFDRYFDPATLRSREETFRPLGLDPARPVLLFGTAGPVMGETLDESHLLEFLLEATGRDPALRGLQVVCRLHPCDRLQNYWAYRRHPRVALSFGTSTVRTLGWAPSREEEEHKANLLRHADLVVTPASTLSIEAPIFDTPTLVSVFSVLQPELYARAYERRTLSRHFRPIVENDWLPLVRSPGELAPMLRRALHDRDWYGEGRRSIVREYCTHTDGGSCRRVAACIDQLSRA